MPERIVTFPDFQPGVDSIRSIGASGDVPGAYEQLSGAFAELEELPDVPLRTLIKRVAPSSNFDMNVAHGITVLGDPAVQQRLGYEGVMSPDGIAYDIVRRTGLYEAVQRPLIRPNRPGEPMPARYDYAVLLEGKEGRVRGAAQVLARLLDSGIQIGQVIGVSSGRKVTDGESDRFAIGTPSDTMMRGVLSEELDGKEGIGVIEMRHTDEVSGKAVAQAAADRIAEQGGVFDLEDMSVLVPAAPGTWVEKGFVARRALQTAVHGRQQSAGFDGDLDHPQLAVVTGSVVLDASGEKTSAGTQRALTSLGDVARSLMYMSELTV